MIRVSTTTLESFRRVLQTEYALEDELVATVKGEFKPNWYMEAGSAWDKLLCSPRAQMCQTKKDRGNFYTLESTAREIAAEVTRQSEEYVEAFVCDECCCWHIGKPSILRSGGYAFHDHAVSAGKSYLGPGVFQVKATLEMPTSFGMATVVAQADHVHGSVITDIKAKFSTPDARDYEASLQWRFYLLIHQAVRFRYVLFDFADPKDGFCNLRGIMSFRFWPYQGMREECESWVERFLQWADGRGLIKFLDREGSSAAA